MKLKLITPDRELFSGEVASVAGCAPGGGFEILENHGAWVSPLEICTLTARATSASSVEPGEDVKVFAVHGGLIEVRGDSILVLGDVAEAATEIDRERAERALRRAKAKVAAGLRAGEEEEYELARRAMARAEARLEALAARR